MSQKPKNEIIWHGRPWVAPNLILRTIFIIAIAIPISWLEFKLAIAMQSIFGIQIIMLTFFLFLLIWVITMSGLLLLRASNSYALRKEGLEVKTGLIGTKVFMLAPAGFSDLEITRSALQRIVGTGNITIRTESEREVEIKQIHNPVEVASILKETLTKPVFKLEKE